MMMMMQKSCVCVRMHALALCGDLLAVWDLGRVVPYLFFWNCCVSHTSQQCRKYSSENNEL